MTKVLFGITAHGFGHLAQTAPVVAALRRLAPDLDVTVLSGLAPAVVEARIPAPLSIVETKDDFGLAMASPFDVDPETTFAQYTSLHQRYDETVNDLSAWLRREGFESVLANMSYLLVAAARRAGIPTIAMSSLNWCDLFRFYGGGFDGADAIVAEMRQAYEAASCIARLEPGMPMPDFRTRTINAAIAKQGRERRRELKAKYGIPDAGRIILFALGGMEPPAAPDWPESMAGDHLLIGPAAWAGRGPWTAPGDTGLAFTDLVASADTVVAKPGYGTVTEVGIAGVPCVMLTRGDWPEEPGLVDWLKSNGRCIYFDGQLADAGPEQIFGLCDRLASEPAPVRPLNGGEEQVALLMHELMTGRR